MDLFISESDTLVAILFKRSPGGLMNFKSVFLVFLGVLNFILITACGKIDSDQVDSKALYFDMAILNKESQSWECYTRVTASAPYGTGVELVDNDRLTCNGIRMRRESSLLGDYIYYTARVPLSQDRKYSIKFFKNGAEYATSEIDEIEDLQVYSPTEGFSIKSTEELNIFYKTPQLSGQIFASLEGVDPLTNKSYNLTSVADTELGALKVPSFTSKYFFRPDQNLNFKLTVTRKRYGRIDSRIQGAFQGSTAIYVNGIITPF